MLIRFGASETLARTEVLAKAGVSTPEALDRARRLEESDAASAVAGVARRRAALVGGRREDVLVSQAELAVSAAKRDQIRAQIEQKIIRAPFAGTVLFVKFRTGEYYQPGALGMSGVAEPLVLFGDTSRLRARVDVDERDVGKVKPGNRGFVTAAALPGRRVAALVFDTKKLPKDCESRWSVG